MRAAGAGSPTIQASPFCIGGATIVLSDGPPEGEAVSENRAQDHVCGAPGSGLPLEVPGEGHTQTLCRPGARARLTGALQVEGSAAQTAVRPAGARLAL